MARLALAFLAVLSAAAPARAQDPFRALNDATIAIHNAAKDAYLAAADPLIVATPATVTVRYKGEIRAVARIPPAYHILKSIGHAPRAVWAAVRPAVDGMDPGQAWRARLGSLRGPVAAARAAVPGAGLSPAAAKRADATLGASLGMIDAYLGAGLPTIEKLRADLRGTAPALLADAAEAARLQLDAMDAAIRPWWTALAPEERARTWVVAGGARPARVDNVAFSYLLNLLGGAEEGRRAIFAEGVFDEERARGTLAAALADRRLAVDFFDEEYRMDRDLLGDGAEARLLELFGRLGKP